MSKDSIRVWGLAFACAFVFSVHGRLFGQETDFDVKSKIEYYEKIEKWLDETMRNAEMGKRPEEQKAILTGIERLRKLDYSKIDQPVVLSYEFVQVSKKAGTLLVVYWAFHEHTGSVVKVTLHSGGELLFKVDAGYREGNKELSQFGEGMYVTLRLQHEDHLLKIGPNDILTVEVSCAEPDWSLEADAKMENEAIPSGRHKK